MVTQLLKNFPVSIAKYSQFIDHIIKIADKRKSAMVCVANVHMFVEAQQSKDFLNIVNNADLVTPDGKPLTWALRILYGIKQDRVAGMDLLPDLLKRMEEQNLSVYFYGGTQQMLDTTKLFVQQKYPNLKVAGSFSPPFRTITKEEEVQIISNINHSEPHVVFVILGCPKQEKWMYAAKEKIHAVMIGVGGALPVMVGLQKRAPLWMQNAGLEWLYRLIQEPGRLFKRYAITNSIFIWVILKEFIRLKMMVPLHLSKA